MLLSPTPRARSTARFTPLTSVLWLSGGLLFCLALSFSDARVVGAQGSPGALSFSQSSYSVNEGAGNAAITLKRNGGTDGEVTAKVTLADVTTSGADYVFSPGAPDSTFASQPFSGSFFYSKQIALQSDGKVLVGVGGFIRLNPDGTPDPSFSHGAMNGGVSSIAIQPDGKIIVAGGFTTIGAVTRNGVARLNSDGSLDPTFNVGLGSTDVNVVTLQSDGKVLVGGVFSNFNLAPNTSNVARLNADGSVDSSFNKGSDPSTTYAIVIQTDNKILLGGLGGPIVRLNPDGSTDNTFSCNLANPVLTLALQPDGKILAGGHFQSAGGQPIPPYIARLNANGSIDPSFNIGQGSDRGIVAIALQADGKVIVAGDFNLFNGLPMGNIARLNPDGSLDNTFHSSIASTPGSGNYMHAVVLQPDGKMLGAGFFTATGLNSTRQYLVRFSGDLIATWKNGDAADKTINLPIVDDVLDEPGPDETLALTLTPLGGATAGGITNANLTIVDNDVPPAITSGPPPQGITRNPYSHTFTATGTPNPTFSLTSGTLPQGLVFQSSGLLSGTPTTAGTFSNITVTASNGVAPPATQTFSITILSAGVLQFSSSAYTAPESDGTVTITVMRVGGSAGLTAINFTTSPNSAAAGLDFTTTSGTLNFADGETSKTFTVPIINDALDESNENFTLVLNTSGTNGGIGSPGTASISITDDDPPPTLSVSDVVLTEGNSGTKTAVFTVTFSAPSGLTVSVNFATANGTATSSSDYQFASGLLTNQPGVTSRTFSITVVGDTGVEPDETFFVNLSNPQNATIARAQGVGTIINDDNNGGNPIDLFGFFVLQHYLDFLNRQPDTAGLNFWINELSSCGSDQACIDLKRINVSAAFFLSIEFQQTGYLVERIYKTAYGNATGVSTFGGTHPLLIPIIRLNEFLPDTQAIGLGVVVGQAGWEQVLENNKQAFTAQFVQRSRFTAAFPTTMTPGEFVDLLNTNAGNVLSVGERATAIGLFGSATNTSNLTARAQALRQVAEDADLNGAEFNRAFVLIQYFGYLRRNPNDTPDSDYSGYDFWLTKLNQFNGNFVNAEMVKAFINSSEYRQRFGP